MKVLKMFTTKIKLFVLIGAIVAYTAFVSLATYKVIDGKYTKEKLEQANAFIEKQNKNDNLKAEISKEVQAGLKRYLDTAKPITKEIQRETITNRVYTDCRSTDGVVQQYERKLDLQ